MANIKLYFRNGFYCYDNGVKVHYLDPSQLGLEDLNNGRVRISYDPLTEPARKSDHLYSEIQDESGTSYGSTMQKVLEGVSRSVDAALQDQTTDAIIEEMNLTTNQTTLSANAAVDDYTITLTDTTGAVDGKHIILFHPASERFTSFYQIGAPAGNVITLDRPVDFAYPAGTFIDIGVTNMNVDGSVTPVVFGLRGTGTPEGVDIAVDVTRIMIGMKCDTAVDLSKFGDLARLTRGITIRKVDGRYKNLFNAKSNGELSTLAYDWTPFAATNPQQGQDGFVMRLTFASQGKMGVVVRLEQGEDIQCIIQDDLRLIDRFGIICEGSIVDKS
jgi:hypothetical protein